MRAAISLLLLLLSMCGVKAQSQGTDTSAELKELRDMVVGLKTELTAVKTRLATAETEMENMERYIKATPKVAFSAGLGSGNIVAGSKDLNLVFSRVINNIGEAYSSTTGFFTAPVRGVYYFRFTVRDDLASEAMVIRMNKNGEKVMWLYDHGNDANPTYLSSGLTLELEKGDTINLMIPEGKRLIDTDNNFCTFSGFLLFMIF
ncbi:complement C1q-like protein 2 [Engraulis encrasicolus]|uniref:complement C1q-like protein 2 n=1 Tax=Engraulis encrasicolus TaxID=184585 RepID=UPI002FD55763